MNTSYFLGAPDDQGARAVVLDCNGCDAVLSLSIAAEQRKQHDSWMDAAAAQAIASDAAWVDHGGKVTCLACLDRERLEQERLDREAAEQERQRAEAFEQAAAAEAARIVASEMAVSPRRARSQGRTWGS